MKRLISFLFVIVIGFVLWGCSTETSDPVSSVTPARGELTALHMTIPTPQNVAATVNGTTVTMSWDSVAAVSQYNVIVLSGDSQYANDTLSAHKLVLTNVPFGSYSVTVTVMVLAGKTVKGYPSDPVLFTLSSVVAPTVTVKATPSILCPRLGAWVTVAFSGVVTNSEGGASYVLNDEYNKIHYSGTVPAGPYTLKLKLKDRRHGSDKDGRQYTFTITATNSAGTATASVVVTVPKEKKGWGRRDNDDDDDDDGWDR